jgi:hypothetical protein
MDDNWRLLTRVDRLAAVVGPDASGRLPEAIQALIVTADDVTDAEAELAADFDFAWVEDCDLEPDVRDEMREPPPPVLARENTLAVTSMSSPKLIPRRGGRR